MATAVVPMKANSATITADGMMVGPLEGRTALDGIRAVERFDAAELQGTRTKVAMGGYSGGSIPTVWGASLATSYAPELDIVAATSGGEVPDPSQNLAPLDGSPLFGTVIGVAIGVDRAYPELGLDAILNGAAGKARPRLDDVVETGRRHHFHLCRSMNVNELHQQKLDAVTFQPLPHGVAVVHDDPLSR